MKEKLRYAVEINFEEETSRLRDILKIKSVYSGKDADSEYPLGKNLALTLDKFLNIAQNLGFRTKNVSNMVGWAEIGEGPELIGILGHLDVVPEGDPEKWKYPPFDAEIAEGNIYARGAADDKGPLMACLFAMKALKDSQVKLNKRFRIIAGLDEETGFRCVKKYLETEEVPHFSFSPDASFPAVNGEKGRMVLTMKRTFAPTLGVEPIQLLGMTAGDRVNVVPDTAKAYFCGNTGRARVLLEDLGRDDLSFSYVDNFLEVTASGLAAHAMNPEKGKNAIQALFEALSQIDFAPAELMRWIRETSSLLKMETDGKTLGIASRDAISGPLTFNLGILRQKDRDMTIKADIRYPISEDPSIMEEKAREIAGKLGLLLQISSHDKPLYISEDNPGLKILLDTYSEITGDESKPLTIGGGTYCKAFSNAVSFGAKFPSAPELAHGVDERISLDDLKKITLIYAESLYNLNEKF